MSAVPVEPGSGGETREGPAAHGPGLRDVLHAGAERVHGLSGARLILHCAPTRPPSVHSPQTIPPDIGPAARRKAWWACGSGSPWRLGLFGRRRVLPVGYRESTGSQNDMKSEGRNKSPRAGSGRAKEVAGQAAARAAVRAPTRGCLLSRPSRSSRRSFGPCLRSVAGWCWSLHPMLRQRSSGIGRGSP
jgi:hypothetical protein